jgi:colanic acid/amylovoran biosynthesis protein
MVGEEMKHLFVLNGSTSNRGCEAILLSTYDILRSAFPNSEFINSSFPDNRVATTPYLNLPDLRHSPQPQPRNISLGGLAWQVAKRAKGYRFGHEAFLPWADVVYSLGGDNYTSDYSGPRGYFEANERILAAGKKLIIWGATIGPFDKDPALERYAGEHLRRVHRIVVRESLTQAYLQRIGVGDNVTLMPDPAFSLAPLKADVSAQTDAMLKDGVIGVNLSPLLARYRSQPERWMDEAARWIIGLLASFRHPVLLIPHVMQEGNDDYDFMNQLLGRIAAPPEKLQLLNAHEMSSRQLKDVIGRLRCFIGARTHATIAALSTNVPTLTIGYSTKAAGINQDIFGSRRWVLDHLTTDTESLVSKTKELLLEEAALRSCLENRNKNYRMRVDELRNIIV